MAIKGDNITVLTTVWRQRLQTLRGNDNLKVILRHVLMKQYLPCESSVLSSFSVELVTHFTSGNACNKQHSGTHQEVKNCNGVCRKRTWLPNWNECIKSRIKNKIVFSIKLLNINIINEWKNYFYADYLCWFYHEAQLSRNILLL